MKISENEKKVLQLLYEDAVWRHEEYAYINKKSACEKTGLTLRAFNITLKSLHELNLIWTTKTRYGEIFYNLKMKQVCEILGERLPRRKMQGSIETKTMGQLGFKIQESHMYPEYRELVLNVFPEGEEEGTEEEIFNHEYFGDPITVIREPLTTERTNELINILSWLGFNVTKEALHYVYENWCDDYKSEYVDEEQKLSIWSPCGCNPFTLTIVELPPNHNRFTYFR